MKTKEKLEKLIDKTIDRIESGELDGERSTAIDDLTQLYKLRLEEIKLDNDAKDKETQRLIDKNNQYIDSVYKSRDNHIKLIGVFATAATALISTYAGLKFYDKWLYNGYKFEEVGTVCSNWTKNLISKITPSLKK